jgi:hypothetical protein
MTFPTIPTVAGGRLLFANQANTTATRTFPAFSGLTYSDGDLLLAVVTTYQSTTNPQFSSWSNGFTELSAGGDQGSSTTMGIGIAYKIASGSESGSLTVTQAATITGHASMCLMAIPLAHGSTAPEAGTIANGTTGAANPASFNPAGWDTEDTLWIAIAASGMTSGTGSWTGTGTTAPANYGNRRDSNKADGSTVGEVEIAVAFRQLNAASEDVGTAGVDTSNARNSALVIAVRPAPTVHTATGVLVGPGAVVVGTARRFRAHSASGAITGSGAVVAGSASRSVGTVTHTASGAIVGAGAVVDGAASRTRVHTASGVIAGAGSTVAGTANRFRSHSASGALAGAGATVAGSANRFRAHSASGVLAGAGAAVSGSASRSGAPVTHTASGAISGAGSAVAGTATRYRAHSASGAIVGAGAQIAGSASRSDGGPVTHTASGAIVGAGAAVSGSVARSGDSEVIQGGHPQLVNTDYYRSRLRKQYEESEPEVVQAIEAIAEEAPKVDVSQADADALMRAELQRIGIAYREAYTEIYLDLIAEMRQQQEDEQIAAIMVALL